MKGNVLHLLLSTSLLATNVVPAAQPIPDIVIQAANAAVEEKTTANTSETVPTQEQVQDPTKEKNDNRSETFVEETQNESSSESEKTESSSTDESAEPEKAVEDPSKETTESSQGVDSADVSQNQEAKTTEGKSTDTRLSGMWGSAPCDFDETTGTLTVNSGYISAYSSTPWKLGAIEATKIQKIKFIGNVIAPTDSSRLFYNLRNLTEIEGLDVLDTSQVTNMSKMFSNCASLTSLDLSNFDTSQVTNMSEMFYVCSSLTSLDLSNFDTSQVTDMSKMFNSCSSLTSLDLSNFDTSQVTDMSKMFYYCPSLTSLDLSNFDTSQVTDMSYMFNSCSSLTSLDLSNFDTSKVTNMSYMFIFCTALTSLDVSNFDTSKVTNMSYMFGGCSSLTSLDLSSFDTSQVTDMSYMFSNCSSLTSLDLSNFDTSKVTNMSKMFYVCASLTSLDLSSLDTSQVTSMYYMFSNCRSLTSLDLSNFDTSKVTSMSYMFYYSPSLTSLDLSNFDTSHVTDMSYMFYYCPSLTSLDLSNFDTSQVTNMSYMFGATNNLCELTLGSASILSTNIYLSVGSWVGKNTSVQYATTSDFLQGYDGSQPDTFVRYDGLWGTAPYIFDNSTGTLTIYSGNLGTASESPWNTGNVDATKIKKIELSDKLVAPEYSNLLFSSTGNSLANLTEITDLDHLDTSRVTDMSLMFSNCESLTELDVSSWDTSQVTDMSYMFNGCLSLTSLDVSNFNTSQVTSMSRMFNYCQSLTSLDLSNFDTNQVVDMVNMFNVCDSLDELTLGEKSIFDTSVSLIEGGWTGENINVFYSDTNEFLTTYDGSQPDTFVRIDPSTLKYWGTAPYSFDESTGTLTIYSGNLGTYSESPWNTGNVDATKIQAIKLVGNIVAPKDSSYLFSSTFGLNYQLEKLVKIDGLNHLDTSQVTDMSYMFYECQALTSLDLNSFNTSQVTTMSNMFNDCLSLTSLDLSSFDTSQVTDMTAMFNLCLALTSLDVSSFDTKQVTTMFYMFNRCSSLTSLDLSSFDTNQVTDMSYMFQKCSSLTSLDLSSFNTSQVTDMSYMFNLCEALTSINVSSFNTSQVTDMSYMFNNCKALKSVDVSSFNTSQVTTMSNMFNICEALTSLDLSSFDTSQVTDMLSMFNRCVSLTSLDLSSFDTNQVTDMSYMFNRCEALTSLDVSNFDTKQVTDMSTMFGNCGKLSSVTLGTDFKTTGKGDLGLPDNRWIGITNFIRFGSSADFMNAYDGSQPDTYVWDRTADLGLATLNQDSMTIGQQDQLSWTIGHTAQSTQGRSAKAIKGTLRTAETIDLADELIVEEQDALGNFVSIVNVPFVNEGTTNGVTTYSYSLSDLTYGHQYKLSVQGTPWNNTTVSSDPTSTYDLAYDANLGVDNGDVSVPTTLTTTDDKRIENGTLAFNEVPTSLKFTTEKLNPNLNGKLIPREEADWQIQINDYRGTKMQAVDNPAVARQDWELFATAGAFKDSNGQEIAQNALNVVYVDEQKTVHELSETNETLLKSHEVSGETPKTDHDQSVDWSEEEGLQAIVHDRNAIEADETYQTDVTFELRSAP
ncbi:BspA family leucine-rich repeat surface protein [Enterococcus casseliflavus]|nr:BspA family leucine-rich repeat surface protein [Enterococcus casseliflavus]